MKRLIYGLLFSWTCMSTIIPYSQAQSDKTVLEEVASFVSPGSSVVQLVVADPQSGKVVKAQPAVLQGALIPGKQTIVFAETGTTNGSMGLTICVLEKRQSGYSTVFTRVYPGKYLFAQDFKTVGLAEVQLTTGVNGLVVITSAGAALGATMEVFKWDPGKGFVNVMPTFMSEGNSFKWSQENGRFNVQVINSTTNPQSVGRYITEQAKWSDEKGALVFAH